ncbi:MAG: helix-turn-helix domain-containing protein [Microbacteriaceae bacterium]
MSADFARLLTVADVAEILNVSIDESIDVIESGELPAIRLSSGVWRVERDVLREFIADKYEESRRRALWHQAEFIDLPDITAGVRQPVAERRGA